ncbi:NB-ARC domain-containing protein [Herbidospora galbida]|uniref:NB-ARC domain-containing protein n=1 Tax=Herbidospora galbida TaxID=2575442 RepID=UPI001FEA8227|nr:NB-ARC domain-containing protein [Herbidospora galbida]
MSDGVQGPGGASPDGQSVSGSTVGGHLNQVSASEVTIHQNAPRPPLPDAAMVSGLPVGSGLGLPRPPAAVFAGRRDALEQIHACLSGSGPDVAVITQAAVHGLGGIGKSELALQYAAAHRSAYGLVWWIDADSPAQIRTGLARLAKTLCVGSHSVAASQATTEEAAAWAMSWLASQRGWLLIFDNVEQAEDLHPYLGRLTGGGVLITTRRTVGWRALGCVSIGVDVLDAEAAVTVLAALIGLAPASPSELVELAALAREVGFLPLALTQASAFIAHTPGIGITDYRQMLHHTPATATAAVGAGGEAAEQTIAKIWTRTRDRIATLDPAGPSPAGSAGLLRTRPSALERSAPACGHQPGPPRTGAGGAHLLQHDHPQQSSGRGQRASPGPGRHPGRPPR